MKRVHYNCKEMIASGKVTWFDHFSSRKWFRQIITRGVITPSHALVSFPLSLSWIFSYLFHNFYFNIHISILRKFPPEIFLLLFLCALQGRQRKKEKKRVQTHGKNNRVSTVQCNSGYCYMTIFLAHRCTREVHFHFLGKIDFATGISEKIIS